MADEIGDFLIENYDVLNTCNGFIPNYGTTAYGFCEPMHQVDVGDIEEKGNDWVGGEGHDEGAIEFVVITLSGMRLVQPQGRIDS
jgi:hypothetical protein